MPTADPAMIPPKCVALSIPLDGINPDKMMQAIKQRVVFGPNAEIVFLYLNCSIRRATKQPTTAPEAPTITTPFGIIITLRKLLTRAEIE